MVVSIIIFAVSILGLLLSSSFGLDSAERLGKHFKLSKLVVGVLFIGFGTSLPELVVSHIASFEGKPLISLGNILGSNISNMSLILGISTLLVPIPIGDRSQRVQVFMMCFVSIIASLSYFIASRFDSATGLILLLVFSGHLYAMMKSETEVSGKEDVKANVWKEWGILIFCFALMFISGKFLVSSITDIGNYLNISEYVISVIGLAFGTSAPELFTALTAIAKKKDYDLIFGNIIGSNIFNIALVLGTTSFYNFDVPVGTYSFDFSIIILLSFYLLGLSILKGRIYRMTGITLIISYAMSIQYWLTNQY